MREFIDISLAESLAERQTSVGWANLTDAEREMASVYLLHWQLLHGGLPAVLKNLHRGQVDAALAGLRRIGATSAASLIARGYSGVTGHDLEALDIALAGSEIA